MANELSYEDIIRQVAKEMGETLNRYTLQAMLDPSMADWGRGASVTTYAEPSGPPLTAEKLEAIYNYHKPEKLTLNGETHEIYGYDIYRSEHTPGIITLIEKSHPDRAHDPGRQKIIIIYESEGKALLYDPGGEP